MQSKRLEQRRNRAVNRGYIEPTPPGYCHLLVPCRLKQRLQFQLHAMLLHEECNMITGKDHHYLGTAIQDAASSRGVDLTRQGRQINCNACKARHDWDSDGTSSPASVLCLEKLVSNPLDLFHLHARFFNQIFGGEEDDDDGNPACSSCGNSVSCGLSIGTEWSRQGGGEESSSGVTTDDSAVALDEVDEIIDKFLSSFGDAMDDDGFVAASSLQQSLGRLQVVSSAAAGGLHDCSQSGVDTQKWADVCSSGSDSGEDFMGVDSLETFDNDFIDENLHALSDGVSATSAFAGASSNGGRWELSDGIWTKVASSQPVMAENLHDDEDLHDTLHEEICNGNSQDGDGFEALAEESALVDTLPPRECIDTPSSAEDGIVSFIDGTFDDQRYGHELAQEEVHNEDVEKIAQQSALNPGGHRAAAEAHEKMVPFFIPCEYISASINRALSNLHARVVLDLAYIARAGRDSVVPYVEASVSTDWTLPTCDQFAIVADPAADSSEQLGWEQWRTGFMDRVRSWKHDKESEIASLEEEVASLKAATASDKEELVQRLVDVSSFFGLQKFQVALQQDDVSSVPSAILVGNVLAEILELKMRNENLQTLNAKLVSQLAVCANVHEQEQKTDDQGLHEGIDSTLDTSDFLHEFLDNQDLLKLDVLHDGSDFLHDSHVDVEDFHEEHELKQDFLRVADVEVGGHTGIVSPGWDHARCEAHHSSQEGRGSDGKQWRKKRRNRRGKQQRFDCAESTTQNSFVSVHGITGPSSFDAAAAVTNADSQRLDLH